MKSSSKKLIESLQPFRALFSLTLIFMFVSGMASVLPSWLVKISVDGITALERGAQKFSILPKQIENYIGFDTSLFELNPDQLPIVLPTLIISVFFIDAVLKFLYQFNSRKLGLLVTKDLRERFHQHINLLSLAKQKKFDSGSLVSVISSDLQQLQSWLAETMMNLFKESFKVLFLFTWLLVLDWKLTLFSLVVTPFFALTVHNIGKKIRQYSKKGQDYVGTLTSFSSETIKNQSIIKAFNLEDWRQDKFIDESNTLYKLHKRWAMFMALVSPLTNIIGAIGISLILFIGLSSVKQGMLTVGEFSSFFVTSILLYDPVKRLGRVSTIFQSALGIADRVFKLLDEPHQVRDNTKRNIIHFENPVRGQIEFNNVCFQYSKLKDVFNNLNLSIPAQSSIALVGPSGGGKTTLVSLLPRFYEIDSGSITIDGTDIRDLELAELRQQIAIVTQEPLLFTGTIEDNILLGAHGRDVSSEELIQAASDSYVIEFSQNMRDGLMSHIGEQGSELSLGQKQRISIARALISQAPIIILDEPTSALDNESQQYVYKAIEKLMQDRTVIIIAHRLSTVKNCKKVVYIKEGKILETPEHYQEMISTV